MAKEARRVEFSKEQQAELENSKDNCLMRKRKLMTTRQQTVSPQMRHQVKSRVVHPNVELRIGRHAKKHLQRGGAAAFSV